MGVERGPIAQSFFQYVFKIEENDHFSSLKVTNSQPQIVYQTKAEKIEKILRFKSKVLKFEFELTLRSQLRIKLRMW